jgi:8-oxo-dGTP diphosphatase
MTKEAPIIAAGGIVLRGRKKPLIAVVQLRRQKIIWALPKGKLHKHETVLDAAKREALEETGRDVIVHEYLGQIAYKSSGMPKLAKFWRMEATGKPQKLMRDVRAVRWLPLNKAIALLTHRREQDFLRRAGPRALAAAANDAAPDTNWLGSALNWLRARIAG